MKQHFSTQWNASIQPRKQRKYLANAPINIRHRMLSSNLSKELRKKYGKRSFPIRKGDEIKIMTGEFRKRTGKIDIVDLKNYRVTIEGIQKTKKDGTKIKVFFHPSNLQIKELNLDDKKRKEALDRRIIAPKKLIKKEVVIKEPVSSDLKKSELVLSSDLKKSELVLSSDLKKSELAIKKPEVQEIKKERQKEEKQTEKKETKKIKHKEKKKNASKKK